MSELAKATLQEIESGRAGKPIGHPIDVQFNPATLQVKLSNTIEGGDSRKRQTRQYIGKSSTRLSFDLIFDTAEDSSDPAKPTSVRERTHMVERFLLPKKDGNKEVPPKVRFHWGHLIFDGIISDLTIDFELFAPNGTPLRAKMGVSIEEQDPKFQFLESGPGAYKDSGAAKGNQSRDATKTKPAPGTPGSSGSPPTATDRTAQALQGESAADFARRMGLDPTKWRSVVPKGADPLALPAGLEIDFDSTVSASAGLSATLGIEADVGVSLSASLGLRTGVRGGVSEAFALTDAGGVTAGIAAVTRQKNEGASQAAASAFRAGDSGVGSGAAPAGSAGSSASRQVPDVDARASAYGHGVPLKPRPRLDMTEQRRSPDVARGADTGRPPEGHAVRDAPWKALVAGDPGRKAADEAQGRRAPTRSCGCRGRCSHTPQGEGCGS